MSWLLTAPRPLGVTATMSPCGCWPRPPVAVLSDRPLLPPCPRPLRPRCAGDSLAPYCTLLGSYAGSAIVFQSSSMASSACWRRDMSADLSLLAESNSSSGICNCRAHAVMEYYRAHGVVWCRRRLSVAAAFIDPDLGVSHKRLH